ncbi:L-serine ammonia-lyase [Oleidesulfovibrio alaskensis G20]|jgi:L-serine dehydratase|uniref:L-serine dehydratase n=1 Tax=Oleidesulfovibrio alaskensis (strain ATCC BAA-1058 / DSM 17464 / G20) TaxID=207559 RepID=Q30WP1_OLEA2|nr:L-serine ammonia-lyase [Oleidesulfovibrio alaskensis]ABB39905.1 L-serine ammonia-lyase [Oleidesulfovibrio alaskensis G20]MBG0773620.1 L-serine ammonia-lyase [Oleidesulfovibrio alaskensis]
MDSITELYRIGSGPSSSHTMGPQNAARLFVEQHPEAARFRVTLYESLASTGKGHLTDRAVTAALGEERCEIVWKPEERMPRHPNGMLFEAQDSNGNVTGSWKVYSVGGGAIMGEDEPRRQQQGVYPHPDLASVMALCEDKGITYWEYVARYEGETVWPFLKTIWQAMQQALERGLTAQGVLPGSIGLRRQAWNYMSRTKLAHKSMHQTGKVTAYALAVAEENAAGGIIVTAPTCGSCGIVPAVLYYLRETLKATEQDILRALATAGLFGNIIKHNASISGAEVGCQGEVGSACAMAAAAATQMMGGTVRQIEYAAEMGLEHHLGLTCDPVDGLVQIPCIERNACAATRALSRAQMAILSDGMHRIPFDEVVAVMAQTGHDLPSLYRETARGGLAKVYAARPQKQ